MERSSREIYLTCTRCVHYNPKWTGKSYSYYRTHKIMFGGCMKYKCEPISDYSPATTIGEIACIDAREGAYLCFVEMCGPNASHFSPILDDSKVTIECSDLR